MEEAWNEGDVATLKRAGTLPLLVRLARGPQPVGREGVVDLSDQLGRAPGGEVRWSGATYRLLRPSLSDLLGAVRRGAQIVTVKDAVPLAYLAGIGPGSRVIEAGSGSGALTIVLAWTVGPSGHVTSYDRRPDFLTNARANVERAGLADRVTFRERDVVADGFEMSGADGAVLDLPEPWEVLGPTHDALRSGGFVATYSPTYNQLERTVRRMRELGFDEVRALELLERGLHVGEGGTRPEFEMLGHTGFLAAGRRVD